ncbi:unnamed protein product [Rhodiola kirilowii]
MGEKVVVCMLLSLFSAASLSFLKPQSAIQVAEVYHNLANKVNKTVSVDLGEQNFSWGLAGDAHFGSVEGLVKKQK